MSMTNSYRRRVATLQKDIASLQRDKGRESAKLASVSQKINSASRAARTTKSPSTLDSKLREIERHHNDAARIEKKIGDIETKIAKKQDDLNRAQTSLVKEEDKDFQKRQNEQEKAARKQSQAMRAISETLERHEMSIAELQELPETIVVLFLAANPVDQPQLRLDEEIRAIENKIRMSEHRNSVQLRAKWAIRPEDVLQGLNEHDPRIVHFSGHGTDTDEIIFHNDAGKAKAVSMAAIVQLMTATVGSIRLVFFNTCYSRSQAEAVVEHVQAAIGMNTAIGDEAARVFAAQFYSAIGFGKAVKQAFEQAKALLMMEGIPEQDTPELFVANGLDAQDIVIVRPPDTANS